MLIGGFDKHRDRVRGAGGVQRSRGRGGLCQRGEGERELAAVRAGEDAEGLQRRPRQEREAEERGGLEQVGGRDGGEDGPSVAERRARGRGRGREGSAARRRSRRDRTKGMEG